MTPLGYSILQVPIKFKKKLKDYWREVKLAAVMVTHQRQ